ncbi:hypothetical protein BDZ85DRAFT_133005 [Elsinoe ampelina]|uniref:Uncharacterized protein n=1 Tax=Elsinoe ampelina TaxID=302913 RepID=A0A6A6G868_9PEZI|nr:hypothetical protein BDZ85DRAFT_133005 [Elsinoe ampelina]
MSRHNRCCRVLESLDVVGPSRPSMTSLLCASTSNCLLHSTRNDEAGTKQTRLTKTPQAYHSTPRICSSQIASQSSPWSSPTRFSTCSPPFSLQLAQCTLNSPNGRRYFDGRAELAEHVIGACTRSGLVPGVRSADLLASTNTSSTSSSLHRLPMR